MNTKEQIELAMSFIGKEIKLRPEFKCGGVGGKATAWGVHVPQLNSVDSSGAIGQCSSSVSTHAKREGSCVYIRFGNSWSRPVVDMMLAEVEEVEVKLNDDYTAIVSEGGIKVGCQTFPLSIIDELGKAKREVTK